MLDYVDSGKEIVLSCNLNMAQACLNMKDYTRANEKASLVLKEDPNNIKALYRRGLSRNNLGLADEAMEDLKKALTIDPANGNVKGALTMLDSGRVALSHEGMAHSVVEIRWYSSFCPVGQHML